MLLLKLFTALGLIFSAMSEELEWFKTMSLYQIYPRSFKDSDGDGTGDLKGIQLKLKHLVDSKFNALWLSPIFQSPMVDFGYDVSDFRAIDPIFGTMEDFENLLKEAHKLNLKVILDFVPNHSSDQHEWFKKSVKKIDPYTDYYIWHEGKVVNGTRQPPNNWLSLFYGPGWKWVEEREAYYYHVFEAAQPDLNFRNPAVVEEIKNILRFWLDKGVDGFRVDAAPHIFEDKYLRDEPVSGKTNDRNNETYLTHKYTNSLDENYDMVRQWQDVLDNEYDSRILMMEAYGDVASNMKYYHAGVEFPFNFGLLDIKNDSTPQNVKDLIDPWMSSMPKGATANWVTGNHDKSRLFSRLGRDFAQAVTTMAQLLPGVAVTYYGEEIGMPDTPIAFEQVKDPPFIRLGIKNFKNYSRDSVRTPFLWDSSTSAGFSSSPETWLPVDKNYKILNLANQKRKNGSIYESFMKITSLRELPAVRSGSLQTTILNSNTILAFSREKDNEKSVYVVVNFLNYSQTVSLRCFKNVPSELEVYHTTARVNTFSGQVVKSNDLRVPARGASVFISSGSAVHNDFMYLLSLLLLLHVSLLTTK